MNIFLIILFIIILIIILIAIAYIHCYNKINETIIRVDEAENRIDSNLRDKYDLLNKEIIIAKNKIKLDENAFKEIIKIKNRKISNFDLDRLLIRTNDEFIALLNNNKELRENDELYKSIKQIELIDEELNTLRTYYNGNISLYNKLIKKFPTLIIAKIKKYRSKLYYDLKDMNDDDNNDFKL